MEILAGGQVREVVEQVASRLVALKRGDERVLEFRRPRSLQEPEVVPPFKVAVRVRAFLLFGIVRESQGFANRRRALAVISQPRPGHRGGVRHQ